MPQILYYQAAVPPDMQGRRLDQAAAVLFPDYSRARLQHWAKTGQLTVDGRQMRPRHKLLGGEQLALAVESAPEGEWGPESMPLNIAYEDDALIVINKAAGTVVHPAAGNHSGTLVNGLLHHIGPAQSDLPRAGIVHRLDKDTTGLMVVAKTPAAYSHLVAQLQARTVKRQYQALVHGGLTGGGKIDAPINRHPRQRKQMAVVAHGGKHAVTHYRLLAHLQGYSHVRLTLETGRTHQIRVHMAHIRHPLVGDPVYGKRLGKLSSLRPELADALRGFSRQALHAAQLGLEHPSSGESMQWQAPLPHDMQTLLHALEARDD